jgi:hypothetical protein
MPEPSLVPERLAYRWSELPQLLGISRSTWATYCARQLCPPSITNSGITVFRKCVVEDWLARSEAAGKFLERDEYVALVAEDAAAADAAQRKKLKIGGAA